MAEQEKQAQAQPRPASSSSGEGKRGKGAKRGPGLAPVQGEYGRRPRPPERRPGTREHLGDDPVYAGEPDRARRKRRGCPKPIGRPRHPSPTRPSPTSPSATATTATTSSRSCAARRRSARRELRAAQKSTDELRAAVERRRVETESETGARRARGGRAGARSNGTPSTPPSGCIAGCACGPPASCATPTTPCLHLGGVLDPDADNAAIDEAIDELIKQRDYLAAAPAPNGERAGLVTQGARSAAPGSGREQTPDDWIRNRARN